MLPLLQLDSIAHLLCLGAHPDDIEIGAGGTIMRLVQQNPSVQIHWVVMTGADTDREAEARKAAAALTAGAAGVKVDIHGFQDGFLPWQGDRVKLVFEQLKTGRSPDLILTHHGHDRHQDHRLVSELTWNTWRDHTVLEYEIVKWDGDLGQPNLYVPLDEQLGHRKAQTVFETYASQRHRSWFSQETFLALMRLRGVECNAGFAEAFHARKLVW